MKVRTVAIAGALLCVPVLIVAQKTSYDFDKTTNFAVFKTYAMKDGTPVGNSLIDNRIIAAIETELAAKGMTKNETSPDVTVIYHMAFDKEKDITAWSSGYGYGYGWGGGWGTTDVRVTEILIGTLLIDIADVNKKALVWRGMGVKEVNTQTKAEKRDKNITNAVKKIMKNYPPKPKT
jgi:Domain of unknown function (DUF4136)